jgi:transcriptional regulator with XRE-family HTH domain
MAADLQGDAGRSAGAINAWRKRVFAERLRVLMDERGLNVGAVAQLLQKKLGGDFNRDNISHYRAGRSLPRPRVLKALSDVLGVESSDLAPPVGEDAMRAPLDAASGKSDLAQTPALHPDVQGEPGEGSAAPAFKIDDLSDGEAWLQINQKLSWPTVIKILQALKGETPDKA